MMLTTKGWRRALAMLLLAGLVAAGCGGDDDEKAEGGDDAPATEETDFDPTGVVKSAYDLVAGQRGGPQLDPTKNTSASGDEGLLYAVFGRLLRPTQDGNVEPDLAEEATIVDANTIEIVVRDGLTWHDGKPFDGASVKAGLEYLIANAKPSAVSTQFKDAESVEATGNTVTVNIPKGTAASWYDLLATWETTIVRPGDDFSKPVGAGPMKVVSYTPQESMKLEKFADYWDADSITVAGVELTNITSESSDSALAAIKSGQIDMALSSVELIPAISGNVKPYLKPVPSRLSYFIVCKGKGALANKAARKAVAKAIDREAVKEAVFDGTGAVATQVWPKTHRNFNPDVEDVLAHDPDAVPELLEEAGLEEGFSFDAYTLQAAGMPQMAEVIKQELAKYKITMNIVPAANFVAAFLEPQNAGVGVVPALPPDLMTAWTGDAIGNACKYNDPRLNELATKLKAVSKVSDEARDLWHEVMEIATEDALSIPVHFGSNVAAYNTDRLADIELWPQGQIVFPDLRETKVKK
jgi:peptide/nickel transport system substrate-binding protein